MNFPIFLAFFICLVSAQQLIDLKTFRGKNVRNSINAHAPYDVFVSATSDDAEILAQIHLITQDKQNQTFLQLKNRKPFLTTSQIQPFPVQTTAYVTTNLTDEQVKNLTGMIFICTTNQQQINNFHVIDVDKPQTLYLPNENQTVLFLNSNMDSSPVQYSTISSWNQSSNSSIYFYKGIPTDLPEKDNTFIFSNPVSPTRATDHTIEFFSNVQKFSLGLGAFYIKYYGSLSFNIAPEYYDVNGTSTNSTTTTGFYMKPKSQKDRNVTIQIAQNSKDVGGVTGSNTVGTLPKNGKVTFGVRSADLEAKNPMNPSDEIQDWTTNFIGNQIFINSENGTDGEFFVQYYMRANQKMNVLILLAFSICLISAQQLIDLKTFRGENFKNFISAHAPYDVFVSATSDDAEVLAQIHLVTQDKQNQTFQQLKNRKPFLTTGQILPFPVQTTAYVTTNLTDQQVKSLTGMIFISTTNQQQINKFHVIDVDKPQTLYLPSENQTVLFLNSNMDSSPVQYSTISSWNQSSNSSIYFYRGFPTVSPSPMDDTIAFFSNVQKFSLGLGAFYIKHFGDLSFNIAPEYYDANGSSTNSITTTGFYMKTKNQKDRNVTIFVAENTEHIYGDTGINIVGNFPQNGEVTFEVRNVGGKIKMDWNPKDELQDFATSEIANLIFINSENGTDGEFFVQYYMRGFQRKHILSTFASTDAPVETTTKGAGILNLVISILALVLCLEVSCD
ncbi:hypothetical protein B9Z55_018075 [Caenorhabditis nigoni]|uniref:CUB-like domain-containing protein n=1 Tax=Caenorhabditis nigoni TaxID=1611254 RepID=A0A2G5TC63_9PELO|nr:hypothetical protein B9Z55_018075 [Caenorhabditis nigoni]